MLYASKGALLKDIQAEFEALSALLDEIPPRRYSEPGVWGDDWTITDLVAHLAEWHAMVLRWHSEGRAGRKPEMPAPGFKWNQTPALNRAIQERHGDRPFDAVWHDFSVSHAKLLALASGLSEAQILEPGHFPWTGKNGLVTYLGANTASHYRFATKVLKRWLRPAVGEETGT